MTNAGQPDIIASLAVIRGHVEQRLAGVSRYRAMRNIEATMAELDAFQELVTPLRKVSEQIEHQLQEMREYRALRTIDMIAPQLADVLAFLEEKSNAPVQAPTTPHPAGDDAAVEQVMKARIVDEYAPAPTDTGDGDGAGGHDDTEAVAVEFIDVVSDALAAQASFQKAESDGQAQFAPASARPFDASAGLSADAVYPILDDGDPSVSENSSSGPETPAVAALAYSLANMMVQSLPSSTSEAKPETEEQPHIGMSADGERTLHEGRAA